MADLGTRQREMLNRIASGDVLRARFSGEYWADSIVKVSHQVLVSLWRRGLVIQSEDRRQFMLTAAGCAAVREKG